MVAIIAYTYEAAMHCPACARRRFARDTLMAVAACDRHGVPLHALDREGNPVHQVFSTDETREGEACDTCHEVLT